LVIGWGTCVKIAAIRTNPSRGANGVQNNFQASATKYVDIVASFQTTYYISGIAPFGDALVVLAYVPEEENGEKNFSSNVLSRQVIFEIVVCPLSCSVYLQRQSFYYITNRIFLVSIHLMKYLHGTLLSFHYIGISSISN